MNAPAQVNTLGQWWNPFGRSEDEEIADLTAKFPAALQQAKIDWAKFKVGVKAKAFTKDELETALKWFAGFPKLWDTLRPNYDPQQAASVGRLLSTRQLAVYDDAQAFVKKLRGNPDIQNLGLVVTTIVVAGILVASVFGVAGAIWAVGYLKKQNNISTMIDRVTAGQVPASVLEKAVAEDGASGGGFSLVPCYMNEVCLGSVSAAHVTHNTRSPLNYRRSGCFCASSP